MSEREPTCLRFNELDKKSMSVEIENFKLEM